MWCNSGCWLQVFVRWLFSKPFPNSLEAASLKISSSLAKSWMSALNFFNIFFLLSLEIWEEAFPRRVIAPDRVDMASSCSTSSSWNNGPKRVQDKNLHSGKVLFKGFCLYSVWWTSRLDDRVQSGHLVLSMLGIWNIPLNLRLSTWGSVEVKDFFEGKSEVLSDTSKALSCHN